MKDFYYILGTNSKATPGEIDAAYQKLARKFQQGEGDEDGFIDAHFREITEAYDVLRDDRRRRKYDSAVKKNQNRQLAIFKLKYLNIALTISFLVITFLFGVYVIRIIKGHPTKNIVSKTVMQPAVVAPVHQQKHHHSTMPVARDRKVVPETLPRLHSAPQTTPAARPHTSVDSTYTAVLHANITGIVYLHQSADYNSPVLAKIPGEPRVRILQKGHDYDKIIFNGQMGYVLKSSIEGR